MIENKYPLILISGLAADETIFQRQVSAFRKVIPVKWIDVASTDTLEDYADKLAASLVDQVGTGPCYVAGLSLGGMMAPMIASHFNTKACILISTIRKPSEFPKRYRVFKFFCRHCSPIIAGGHFLLKMLVTCTMPIWRRLRSPERIIIMQQLYGCNSRYFAQQLRMLFTWTLCPKSWRHDFTLDPTERYPFPIYQIHGMHDHVLMCSHTKPDRIVDGRHVLPLYRTEEVNGFIESVMAETNGLE